MQASSPIPIRSVSDLPGVLDPVAAAMAREGYTPRQVLGVQLALEEALVNALEHGHRGDPTKQARVRYRVTPDHVLAEVEDEGPGFDPASVPDPRTPEGLRRPYGRGLLLMRHFLTEVRYNGRGNAVTLRLCRTPVPPASQVS